jgi:hypothetical protein
MALKPRILDNGNIVTEIIEDEIPTYKCPFQKGKSCPTPQCALYIPDDDRRAGECAFRRIATK